MRADVIIMAAAKYGAELMREWRPPLWVWHETKKIRYDVGLPLTTKEEARAWDETHATAMEVASTDMQAVLRDADFLNWLIGQCLGCSSDRQMATEKQRQGALLLRLCLNALEFPGRLEPLALLVAYQRAAMRDARFAKAGKDGVAARTRLPQDLETLLGLESQVQALLGGVKPELHKKADAFSQIAKPYGVQGPALTRAIARAKKIARKIFN